MGQGPGVWAWRSEWSSRIDLIDRSDLRGGGSGWRVQVGVKREERGKNGE